VSEGHVADAELQRDHEVHQSDDKQHRHEEDHDGAVRRENLVEMLGWQIALRAAGRDRLLRIMIASEKPRSWHSSASARYMTPIRL
jgi:hypothetical protein